MKIKTVCLLLGLLHVGSATALGLGDLNVRSYLGQPLHVTVALLGVTPNTTADCFSLDASSGSVAPIVQAQLRIERAGDRSLLHIRTKQAINDPVAQFVLVSDCEARLKRDYVVLLDPPAQVESIAIAPSEPLVEKMAAVSPSTAQPTRKSSSRPKRPRADTPRMATSVTPKNTQHEPATSPITAPRLILSGRHGSAAQVALALRLDTNLPDLARPRPEPLTATEVSDENTALTRKLAYLETQLASLQQRNIDLEARNPATVKTIPPAPKQAPQWPLYLLFVGLIMAGGMLAAWLHRRSRSPQPALTSDDAWMSADSMPSLPEPRPVEASKEPVTRLEPQKLPDMAPLEPENTEVKDDILDQAEVYMAHGHGELAIHLLQEHLRETPSESPVPWLLLLDLLQREGDAVSYAAASTECRRYFNVKLTGQPVSQDNEVGLGLEAYPHILEALVKVWKLPGATDFFNDLIYDNRGGTRIGFEPSVYRDILMLRDIAEQDRESKAA